MKTFAQCRPRTWSSLGGIKRNLLLLVHLQRDDVLVLISQSGAEKSNESQKTQTALSCAAVCSESERKGVGVGKRYVSNGCRCCSCWRRLPQVNTLGVTRCMQLHSNSSSSNWILVSCQPHRVTSGQSNWGHKQIHTSKLLFSRTYQPSVKSVYKTNHFANMKQTHTNIRYKFSKS